ncbi:MAG: DUF4157 domain-containing protein [Anaerolineales bacterium]|nr:DUF4157 domain-containing protein [Anaerolineales bacterium]
MQKAEASKESGKENGRFARKPTKKTTAEPSLQQMLGNRTVGRLAVQRKMTLNAVNDPYEQEADSVAQQVVSQLNAPVQRQGEDDEIMTKSIQRQEDEDEIMTKRLQRQEDEEEIMAKRISNLQRQEEDELMAKPLQRQGDEDEIMTKRISSLQSPISRQEDEDEIMTKHIQRQEEDEELMAKSASTHEGGVVATDVESRIQQAQGGGQPLTDGVRQPMEQAFGADFGSVRIHTNSEANDLNQSLQARAFTTGQDIFFKEGEYSPGNSSGQELLAHELTHVVQQNPLGLQRQYYDTDRQMSSYYEGDYVSTYSVYDETTVGMTSPDAPMSVMGPQLIVAEDVAEFDLLKNRIEDKNVYDYVSRRAEFFGSRHMYELFAAESDAELDETKGLRGQIDLNGNNQAQTVFYRWVRMAYFKAGITDVPFLIKKGRSEELETALAEVKQNYNLPFRSGGFNPRPKKSHRYRYRLGTLSEHALGNAIDVEAKQNPILSLKEWKFIETITDQTIDRSPARWLDSPEALWQDIYDLNDLFVVKIAEKIEEIIDSHEKSSSGYQKTQHPTEIIFSSYPKLKDYAEGFFTLDWELVEQLHEQGFKWGATFSSSVDLHHFEL